MEPVLVSNRAVPSLLTCKRALNLSNASKEKSKKQTAFHILLSWLKGAVQYSFTAVTVISSAHPCFFFLLLLPRNFRPLSFNTLNVAVVERSRTLHNFSSTC